MESISKEAKPRSATSLESPPATQPEQAALWLAAIVESSEDAIVSKDLNGIITSWNKSAERILGYTVEEVIGRPVTLIIPLELREEEAVILSKLRAGERIEHFETIRVNKNGDRLNVSLTISPIKDAQGKVVGAAKILRNITEQKRMEAALQTSEKLASVGRLAATIAHEINNPLEAVTNFVYLAKHQPDLPDNVRYYLSCADQELGRVAHIAQQTLGFYRDSSRPTPLAIPEIIDEVLGIYDRKFKYKNLKIDRRMDSDMIVSVMEGELKQILSNLIANAIQASPEGGSIIISARNSRDFRSGRCGIRITVADYGVGIAPQHKARIFYPFFTTKQELGTGLGLWITKELLEKKGGHIRFRSSTEQPSGTVMSFFLPSESPEKSAELVA